MHERLIEALLAKGWTYPVIALRSKIDESRLRRGSIGRREFERLLKVAETEARVYLDELED